MIAVLGQVGVAIAWTGALWLGWTGLRGAPDHAVNHRGLRGGANAVFLGATLAMLALETALLTDDFSLVYTAENHARSTPFPFDVATAWAALEGSIVLWGLVLAAYTWSVARRVHGCDPLGAVATSILGVVGVFFFGLMLTVANPFVAPVQPVIDGPGPNPLLQNHALMAIHPPLLYLGFVGMTVPFAFAVAKLITGEPGSDWLRRTRSWTIVGWGFLTAGIVIGGWWSYEVLGWGGFWAWDPVENASFMPWLTATAFIHSSLVETRRGMLRGWNVILAIITFGLTIFGTFLTRSGVIGSVHAFSQSAIGPALLGFLAVVMMGSLGLFAIRGGAVVTPSRLDHVVSREGAFLLNNLLLTVFAFTVMVGTTYPLVVEATSGDRLSVGRPFFDRFAVPLSYLLLAAMGVGGVTPWRAASRHLLAARLATASVAALLSAVVLVLMGIRIGHVVAITSLAVLWAVATGGILLEQARRRAPDAWAVRITGVVTGDPGYWGGQLSHLGVVLLAVAISLYANLSTSTDVTLTPGSTADVGDYTLRLDDIFSESHPNRRVVGAAIEVRDTNGEVTELRPRLNEYPNFAQAIATPAVMTTVEADLYLSPRQIAPGEVIITAQTHPGMWLLWLGGLTAAFGALFGLIGRSTSRPRAATRAPVR